jgi:lipoprotein
MKKLLVIFMALCLSFAAVSCGKKETTTTTGSTSTGTEQKADTSATTG